MLQQRAPGAGAVGLSLAAVMLAFAVPAARAQSVPYEKYTLPNGMTVILHEDHSLPVASVNIWYRVASKDEAPGRSGFAHLFEHLMFMGTDRVPGLDFDNIMEAGGGRNNASTSEDRTNYYSVGPSELLPTLLWLDADRLEGLGAAMTQEKLDKQRDVVRNERRQTTENVPYGVAENEIVRLMYPRSHPYWGTVIGSHEDLEAATLDDVKNFFATYYVPSNASLVVAGDFDPTVIKPLIDRLFGTLPRGNDVTHAQAEPARVSGVKRVTYTDDVQFPRSYIVYHSPKAYAPGDAEMGLAAGVLAGGISSRLYQRLIYAESLATDVEAMQYPMLLGSLFVVQVTAAPGVTLDAAEKAVDEVIGEFVAKGPTPEELERQKAQVEMAAIAELQSLLAKADKLNEYEFHFGEPDSFKRDLDRYRNATPDKVMEWSKKVLTPNARLILRVIPEIDTPETNPRDERPTALAASPFSPLVPETFKLPNGITVHHWKRSELPLVSLVLMTPFGSVCEPAEHAGLSALTADMLDEGAGDRSAIAFAEALDSIGAALSTDVALETTEVGISVLSRHFDPALALFADAVRRPAFNPTEWERVHDLHVQGLEQAQDHPGTVASWVGMRAFFGDGHPYSRPTDGFPATADAVNLDNVRTWYQRVYRPESSTILVAGDIETSTLRSMLESAFGDWRAATGASPPAQPAFGDPANVAMRVVIVDKPDAVQTVIRFIAPAPPYGDSRRPALELVGTVLGGSFTSRLNQNLREDKGYTYGARCAFLMNPSAGMFTAGASVRADVTGASIREFLKEFAAIRSGDISGGEASKARSTNRMSMVEEFQGLGGIVSMGVTLVRNGMPFSSIADELAAIDRTTEAELNRLAYEAVPLQKALLVLVGDGRLIREQLAGLELPEPIEMDSLGRPVGSN